MMWQTPVISLTAQAFLFTIALGPGSSLTSRLIAAFLAAIAAFASVILMRKHRALEEYCSRQLEQFERSSAKFPIHARPEITGPFWVRWRSNIVWSICLS